MKVFKVKFCVLYYIVSLLFLICSNILNSSFLPSAYAQDLIPTNIPVQTIALESAGEPYRGQLYVACVIRNRMRLRSQSADAVCLARKQFSCWNGTHRKLTSEEIKVAQRAWLESATFLFSADHYCRIDCNPSWSRNMIEVARIGHHKFYSAAVRPRSSKN
jgi:hypothetical protein